jgi:choline dehydrogenase-like flavoprotein
VLDDLECNHLVLAATLEDAPYADNRVTLASDADRTAAVDITYRLRPYEMARMATFSAAIFQHLKPLRVRRIAQAANNERIAHACGTCRFGTSPRDSVLDANNRAHGIANLYVVDASFFPSSGGTNPGLTIAANALRVASTLLPLEG